MVNEGLGKVMRFGANDDEVLGRIAGCATISGRCWAPPLRAAGGLELAPLISRGLAMGDEMHQRNVACSALTLRALAPHFRAPRARRPKPCAEPGLHRRQRAVLPQHRHGDGQGGDGSRARHRGLQPGGGRCAATAPTSASGSRGTGDQWFTAPVEMPKGLYFPGYSEQDANPDMGDSAIMETIGLGAFAMAAAPAVMGFVGAGRASDALAFTRAMGGSPRQESALGDPGARTARACPRASTCARSRERRPARDQHRHRAPQARRRAGRRGRGARAAQCFDQALLPSRSSWV
jgi:hypothetical protein